MMSWRRLPRSMMLLGSLMIAALLVFAACSSEEAAPARAGKYGGTLRIAMVADTNTLDPAFSLASPDNTFSLATYDNLVLRMHDLTLKPMLATSWEPNDDLTSYTFHLREGVKFHHGKTFNADDVVFTFERLIDPDVGSPARGALSSIVGIVKVDDYTVRFELSSPNAFMPESLSIYQARITPSDIDPALFHTQEYGTGPFIQVEFLPGERSVLKRNPDYWQEGLPYLDELIFYYMAEPETRLEALKTGSVDLYQELEALSVDVIEATAGLVVSEATSAAYINMAMIETAPPFDNKLVRQAFQAATDRETILQVALFGRGMVGNDTTIPPNDPHYDSTQEIPPYDVEKAKRLLAEAGYPDGLDVTLHTSSITWGMNETAVAFKESAAPAGIRVTIKTSPEDIYWSDVWMSEPFTMVAWNGRPPDQALSIVYLCDTDWNETYMCIPELDALIERARGEADFATRKATYAEVQRILIDDASRIIPVFRPLFMGMADNLRGVSAHPNNWLLLHEAWLDD
jgi:peptide/nickel transport system substrate-binding protein